MADTYNKKALQQKKAKKQQDKLDRREERKMNNDKGKSLDDMIMYVDEFGNLTNVHPDQQVKKKVDPTISYDLSATHELKTYTGKVALFFHDKNYGFITEDKTRESIFVHANKLMESVTEHDRVTFEKERTPKGYAAVNVRKIK